MYSADFNYLKLFTEDSAGLIKKNLKLRNEGEAIPTTEYTCLSKDGKKIETFVTTKMINYRGEKALLGIVTDITDVKFVLKELKESEERYKTITSSITDYIYRVKVSNDKTIKTEHGPACIAITGYTPEEFSNNEYLWIQMVHPDDLDIVQEQIKRLLQGENVQPIEHRIIHKNGSIRWIKNSKVPFYDSNGRLTAYDGIIHDITGNKNDQIEKENLNEALMDINKELENLVYVTSHDLRSPLINIQGFTRELDKSLKELVKIIRDTQENGISDMDKINEIIDREISLFFSYIDTSVVKMDQLLTGLLKYSRINKASLEIVTIDMNELVNDIIENMKYMIQKQNINFMVDDLPECRGDKTQLNQAFTNIIDNAVKYLSPSRPGVIHVSGYTSENESVYSFSDNGMGIEAIHQKRIFEIFFRSHRNESIKGEGLGLAIVQKIIHRHQGKIRLESTVNEGSTFYISLPR